MSITIKVRGIALHNGKLLCVRLKPRPGALHDFWCLPGGNAEDGEPFLEALKREMVEELGVEPKIGRLLYVQQFTRGGKYFLDFLFCINNAGDYLNIDLAKTTHGMAEIEEAKFIDPATATILPKFLTTENLGEFIAGNQPVRFFAG